MSPERLDIARRLVACKGWRWLPGMVAVRLDGDEPTSTLRVGHLDEYGVAWSGASAFPVRGRAPDIDDDLTRLGMLAVVRLARPAEVVSVRYDTDRWIVTVERRCPSGTQPMTIAQGPSEEAALLAALEGAP